LIDDWELKPVPRLRGANTLFFVVAGIDADDLADDTAC